MEGTTHRGDYPKAKPACQNSEASEFTFAASQRFCGRDVWIIDSGATSHMYDAHVRTRLLCFVGPHSEIKVSLADGKKITTEGIGSWRMAWMTRENEHSTVLLTDVLYVPQFQSNLISVRKLTAKGVKLIFDEDECHIQKDNKVIADTIMSNGMYRLLTTHAALKVSDHTSNCLHTWHRILEHQEPGAIRDLENNDLASSL